MSDREKIIQLAEIMGWKLRAVALTSGIFDLPDGRVRVWPNGWNPLVDLNDAMGVSERCGRFDMISVDDGWMVGDGRGGFSSSEGVVEMTLSPFAIAETLPLAICEAALKSVRSAA